MNKADNSSMRRAIAYSLLAHIKDSGNLTYGPLDIFVPLVKNILHKKRDIKGEHVSEISEALQMEYSIDVPSPVMLQILRVIANEVNEKAYGDKPKMVVNNDGSFWIENYIFDDYEEEIHKSREDVNQIKKLYSQFCKIVGIAEENDDNAIFHFIERNRVEISYYLSHNDSCKEQESVAAAKFVEMFKSRPEVYNKLRDMYLGSMLTSYLEFQPQNVNMGVELLLDTNFIVSLLDLNTSESTKTCNALISVCRNLGYTFTVLQDTVDEIQSLLAYKSENLNTAIIAKAINKEDIYNACERRHLSSVDLDRLSDNLAETLTQTYKFTIKPHPDSLRNKARYSKEYETLRKVRNTDKAALHDAMAIIYVREKRNNKTIRDFEKCNCWFVNNAISHDSESNGTHLNELQLNKSGQPEIIKVDDLLNIIWLSNPQIDLSKDEIIDMGLTSLISYTINSSLPKSRIIKELDDNIQKYRKDYNLTDKDVVNLSTRIANRQIKDVDSLNQLAKNDAQAFATRVKDESRKEELAKTVSARKFEELFKTAGNLIKELQSNKENLQKKHEERMEALDARESALQSESARLKDKESEMKREKDSLSVQITEKDALLRILYDKYCRDMESKREDYLKRIIKKKKCNSIIWVFILGFIILIAFCLQFFDNSLYSRFIAFIVGSQGWGWILPIALLIIEYFVISKVAKFYDPVYLKDFRETIQIPEELITKSYEVYIREAQQKN